MPTLNMNTSSMIDPEEKVYVSNDKIMRQVPFYDEGGTCIGYKNETIMTKEVFIECFENWLIPYLDWRYK